jgi:SOS-response transcriptional repressor LexA
MYGLTPTQFRALHFIKEYIATNGYSPSYQEILIGIGNSPKSRSAIFRIIRELAERGHIVFLRGRDRSIAVVEE